MRSDFGTFKTKISKFEIQISKRRRISPNGRRKAAAYQVESACLQMRSMYVSVCNFSNFISAIAKKSIDNDIAIGGLCCTYSYLFLNWLLNEMYRMHCIIPPCNNIYLDFHYFVLSRDI